VELPDDIPVLSDGRVTLRAHRLEDADGVLEQCLDPLSIRWTTIPVPYTHQDARRFVTEAVPSGWAEGGWAFAVEAADEAGVPRFCGTVELRDRGNRRAEIAYGSHPWARGRGIMVPALRLLLDWGFTEQRLRAVIWWANTGNWASRRVAWRLGFSCDGTLERWLVQRGDLLDAWVGTLHVDDERAPRRPWLEVPVLTGRQVVLRRFREEDAARVAEACNDDRTARWMWRLPAPYTLEDARAFLLGRGELMASGSGVAWAVADPATDRLVGHVSLFDLKPGREAEIGFWTHPEARGRGVMTEACGLAVRHGLGSPAQGGLGLRRLLAFAAEGNTASRRVIENNGFTRVGRERNGVRMRDGSLVDSVSYDLLVEEYAAPGG
jgi:RimJ/RimL family protein N-acetyltransferase